ncbi:hypothetical protein Dsin_011206 [Dipteronia sinensis]|uniref:SWIM-type domain-containing protein n=1 Tax=Dipteronia sinensis TaxID=43782 RepID=A0AAE0EDD8_9ROSI|nr:hypothetical protein Dsin_011206 [Dipteronia sinensis]
MSDRQKGVVSALEIHFPFAKTRCDHVTNNMMEAFISMLGDHRAKTYLELLEFIRRMIMKRFQMRKEESATWRSQIPSYVNSRILKAGRESRLLKMINAGNGEYELMGPTRTYGVKLKEFTCRCGCWQISGVPCSHSMTTISHACGRDALKDRVAEFVHQSLTKSAYVQTYQSMIHPFPDLTMWPEVQAAHLIPPPLHATPGRLKLQRRREPNEIHKHARSGSVVCRKCK